MADTIDSLHQTHLSNPSFQPIFYSLDPISLIHSLNHVMERGPRYQAYADLRESKLRMKFEKLQEWEAMEVKQAPVKKQVKFSSNSGVSTKRSSVLIQSVPDFSSALRKENRKPPVNGGVELTPPKTEKSWSKANGYWSNSKGSQSANAGEKKKARLAMARKSYASIEELNAINGVNRGGKSRARLM
ncbi:hypothetical protein E1A91_D11G183300v1 [Gossypium mustelinum]|uniref:Uncharacterized protein n=2 Tax=Gossypium TaxID=3633 RepID=A0A0D2TH87_GOSRA|nr:hypothetical protein B456_007G182000 [Gossypium raimondii]TYI56056.1 hypothetical protein E1A91_D11G183300v1 [Gossypium mustelinum]